MRHSENKTKLSKKIRLLSNPSKISHTKSQKQIFPHFYAPCQTHQFLLRPYGKNSCNYFKEKVCFYFSHQNSDLRPYCVVLQDFKGDQYMPLFGYETSKEKFISNKQKYKQHFEAEKNRLKDKKNRNLNKAPIPKHSYCQVCKTEFQNYEDHIFQLRHLKNMKQSQGNAYIQQSLQLYNKNFNKDLKNHDLQMIDYAIDHMNDINQSIKKRFDNYMEKKTILMKKISVK